MALCKWNWIRSCTIATVRITRWRQLVWNSTEDFVRHHPTDTISWRTSICNTTHGDHTILVSLESIITWRLSHQQCRGYNITPGHSRRLNHKRSVLGKFGDESNSCVLAGSWADVSTNRGVNVEGLDIRLCSPNRWCTGAEIDAKHLAKLRRGTDYLNTRVTKYRIICCVLPSLYFQCHETSLGFMVSHFIEASSSLLFVQLWQVGASVCNLQQVVCFSCLSKAGVWWTCNFSMHRLWNGEFGMCGTVRHTSLTDFMGLVTVGLGSNLHLVDSASWFWARVTNNSTATWLWWGTWPPTLVPKNGIHLSSSGVSSFRTCNYLMELPTVFCGRREQ